MPQVIVKMTIVILTKMAVQMSPIIAKKYMTTHSWLRVENLIAQIFKRKVSLIGTKLPN